MTYDLEQVKSAVLAVAPDAIVANDGYHLIYELERTGILVYTEIADDGSVCVEIDGYLRDEARFVVRAIIDDLDRQDAAREGAQS